MKIAQITLTVLELPGNTSLFSLEEQGVGVDRYWLPRGQGAADDHIHLLRVQTDEGVEGICTVGDARYTQMRRVELEQLRLLCLGENPFDRERLAEKLTAATRGMFSKPGWWGALDNCLWDIAGKAAGLPVYALLGRARARAPAYYNNRGDGLEVMVEDTLHAVEMGFPGVKDHFRRDAKENIVWQQAMRGTVGPDIALFHDAALAHYNYADALRVGRALEELDFRWLEEPLPDARQGELQRLAAALDIPILSCETLMNDVDLSARWLIAGATDLLRANARHGTTNILKLAHLAEMHGTTIELNGPGGFSGWSTPTSASACATAATTNTFPAAPGTTSGGRSACSTRPCQSGDSSAHRTRRAGVQNGIGHRWRSGLWRCCSQIFRSTTTSRPARSNTSCPLFDKISSSRAGFLSRGALGA